MRCARRVSTCAGSFRALPKFAHYEPALPFRDRVRTFVAKTSRNARRELVPAKIAPSGAVHQLGQFLDGYLAGRAHDSVVRSGLAIAHTIRSWRHTVSRKVPPSPGD